MKKNYIVLSDRDEKIVQIALERPQKGNIFFPGAGFEGDYIDEFEKIMKEIGFINVQCDRSDSPNTSGNMLFDVITIDSTNMLIGTLNFIDHLGSYPSLGPQLNLIGYSYGGVVAAAAAAGYTNVTGFVVDNLILIATPIYENSLNLLRKNKKIKKIIIRDLIDQGDVVYAGIPRVEMIAKAVLVGRGIADGEKHFYYAKDGNEGDVRRRELLSWIKAQGVH